LKEQVRYEPERIVTRGWDSYPILTFDEAPQIEVAVIDRPDMPPLGAGEAVQGPTAAAIANAVHNAIGVRLRDMPFTRERVLAALA
jgi:CO/xanthine dehydrogenase Mo-binding subunit